MTCFYTNVPLTLDINNVNTVSLDRIDSNGSYTKDNVVFCCQFVNKCKLTLSVKEFIDMCERVVVNKNNILTSYVK